MKTFDFYEFAGVLAPGALTLYGLTLVYPGWQPLIEGSSSLSEIWDFSWCWRTWSGT